MFFVDVVSVLRRLREDGWWEPRDILMDQTGTDLRIVRDERVISH